jgi:hypothetical protein
MRFLRTIAVLCAALLGPCAGLVTAAPASACTDTFSTAVEGDWFNGADWSLGHPPGPADDACIAQGEDFLEQSTSVGTLTVSGHDLRIERGTLTVGGAADVTAGGDLMLEGDLPVQPDVTLTATSLRDDGSVSTDFVNGGDVALPAPVGNGSFFASAARTLLSGSLDVQSLTVTRAPVQATGNVTLHAFDVSQVAMSPGEVISPLVPGAGHRVCLASDAVPGPMLISKKPAEHWVPSLLHPGDCAASGQPLRLTDARETVAASPAHALPGAHVTVTGSGFWPGEAIDLATRKARLKMPVPHPVAAADGTFTATVTISPSATPVSGKILATGESSHLQTQAPLTVD